MFKQLIINAILQSLPQILCQIFGYCLEQEDCPDGVCEPLIDELEAIQTGSPLMSANPANVSSSGFAMDWSKLPEAIDAVRAAVKALLALFGKEVPKVG